MKVENPFGTETAENAIDMHHRQSGCFANMLLRKGKMHFFTGMARPLHPTSDKHLQQRSRDALARRALSNAG